MCMYLYIELCVERMAALFGFKNGDVYLDTLPLYRAGKYISYLHTFCVSGTMHTQHNARAERILIHLLRPDPYCT